MSVKDKLKALQKLQTVDLEILELKKAGEAHPKRLAALDADLAKLKASVDAERNRLAENERARKAKLEEIEGEKDKVKKWEARLAEMRTTREYAALAREIDIAKKTNLNADEDIKALSAAAEDIKRAMQAREADLKVKEEASLAERRDLQEKIGSLDGKIAELTAGRAELAKLVDPPLLSRYEMLRKNKGQGLASITNGTCSGCFMRLPPQMNNIIRTGATIEQCPSCQRIVYPQELLAGE